MNYQAVIGLEVHVALNTESKIFCGCSTAFGAPPNTQVCPVCLGLPGVLPVLNRLVVEKAVMVALALGCRIAPFNRFHRKNYYYPDQPKNYQITQYDFPLASGGWIEIPSARGSGRIDIRRVHMEEDAGKLVHVPGRDAADPGHSLVDFNRAGVPLVEIVSEPTLVSPAEARDFLQELRTILLYLDVSDCRMQEGSLRCDANVSVRPRGEPGLGVKTELKNLNSFKAVQRALEFEIKRQTESVKAGTCVEPETRLWDERRGQTLLMRGKEDIHDYRYFPEPDLPPLKLGGDRVDSIRSRLPELPAARRRRYCDVLGLSPYEASVIIASADLAEYFESCCRCFPDPKMAASWVTGEFKARLNERGLTPGRSPVTPDNLSGLLNLVTGGTISGSLAKEVLQEMFETGQGAEHIVRRRGLVRITDREELAGVIEEVIGEQPEVADRVRSGKLESLDFLVGQVMKKTRGQADGKLVNRILKEKLLPGG